jgi:hypothetical protein
MQKVDSVVGDALIELFTHLDIVVKSHLTFWDSVLPFRRRTDLVLATRSLARSILLNTFCVGPSSQSETRDSVDAAITARMLVKERTWKDYCMRDGIYGYKLHDSIDKKLVRKIHIQIIYMFSNSIIGLTNFRCKLHTHSHQT